jgi:hypothetical protein
MKSVYVSLEPAGKSILQPSWKEAMTRLLQGRQAAQQLVRTELAQDSESHRVPFGMELKTDRHLPLNANICEF